MPLLSTAPVKTKIECYETPKVDTFAPLVVIFHEAWTPNKVHVFGLTPRDYENLSINVADIHKALKQKTAQVEYYTGCIASHNTEKGTP